MAKTSTVAELTWIRDLTLSGTSGHASITLDSAGLAGPSPMQALGFALAGCMTMDIAHTLTKGRHTFRALHSRLVADRAPDDPHRFVRVTLHVTAEGAVPAEAIDRAIALSREKYCSVWHSMRQDIEFTTTYDVRA